MAVKRIIVAGDILGQFSTFFKRLKNINEKAGPFDLVLCTGSFFSFDDEDSEDPNLVYIAKEYDVRLPIYVLGPVIKSQKRYYKPLFDQNLRGVPTFEEGYDIAVNVTYLGKQGVLTTVDEIKIAYLSGFESETPTDCSFNSAQIDELVNKCSNAGRIDILLASSSPYHVNEFSLGGKSVYLNRLSESGSILVSKLAKYIMPRYHFASSQDEFYEREPYRNHVIMQEQPKLVTRFISISKAKQESKPKWLYAFELKPAKFMSRDEITKQPDDTTENPYVNIDFDKLRLVKKEATDVFNNGSFFFGKPTNPRSNNGRSDARATIRVNREIKQENQLDSLGNHSGHSSMNHNERNSIKRPFASGQSNDESCDKRSKSVDNSCWFCLSSPQIEKHLIISIGDHSYLGNFVGSNHFSK